jgi:hypothetical protein
MRCRDDYDTNQGSCCACYGKKMGNPKEERKKLTSVQRQILNWELVKQNAKERIEEIKNEMETD